MQQIIEEVVRWLGFAILRAATLGRYRGGKDTDRLSEGAIGLGAVIGTAFLVFALMG